MKIIEKDILTVEKGMICQSVNCQSAMNSGLAKGIREKWPSVYQKYKNYSDCFKPEQRFRLLGSNVCVNVAPDLFVSNLFCQLFYGYDKQRYTDYSAIQTAFLSYPLIRARNGEEDIYFVYNFACDRGGGDWNIVSKMIEFYFPNAIICKLP